MARWAEYRGDLWVRHVDPGRTPPLGSPFPLTPIAGYGYVGGLTVDNSGTGTDGRIIQAGGDILKAWEPDGTELGIPFPIAPVEPGRYCQPAVDSHGTMYVSNLDEFGVAEGRGILPYSPLGVPGTPVDTTKFQNGSPCAVDFDSHDNMLVGTGESGIFRYTASSHYTEAEPVVSNSGNLGTMTVDRTNDHILGSRGNSIWEYDEDGNKIREFGDTHGVDFPGFQNVAVNETTQEIYVADSGPTNQIRVFGPPKLLPNLTTNRPDEVTTTSANVYGHVDLDGGPNVTECYFEYGPDQSYSTGEVQCTPGASPGEPITGATDVSSKLIELVQGTTYNYRLVAKTSEGTVVGNNQTLVAADPPLVRNERIVEVTADHALLKAEINPRGVNGSWRIEYGAEDCGVSECQSSDSENFVLCSLFSCPSPPTTFVAVSKELINLTPGQLHHFRFAGDNDQAGTGYGEDATFRTFPLDPAGIDPCPNSNARKLSGASKLSHCRGFELVSAADSGGYDVASNIVEGETPLPAYPQADDQFLYTTSVGKLPGVAGFPVNLGTDPYVASRGAGGWKTKYMGLPATLPSASPFASTVSGANANLTTFAFGEPDRCSPCFGDGTTGIPLRLPDGGMVQGMKGSIEVANPEPAGEVDKPLSTDGSHFVFGSEQKFEPAGNTGSPTLYDRNLNTDTTQVVSTMPDGSTMIGDVASSTSPRTAVASWSPNSSATTRRATRTTTFTCTSATTPTRCWSRTRRMGSSTTG